MRFKSLLTSFVLAIAVFGLGIGAVYATVTFTKDSITSDGLLTVILSKLQFDDGTTQETAASTAATFVVCASDAKSTKRCDYVADGTDDHVEIQAAIDALPDDNTAFSGGRVVLSDGVFKIGGTIQVRGSMSIVGQGVNPTTLEMVVPEGSMFEYSKEEDQFFFYLGHMRIRSTHASPISGWGIDIGTGSGTLRDGRLEFIFVSGFPSGGVQLSHGWGWTLDHVVSEFHKNADSWGLAITGGNTAFINSSKFAGNEGGGVLIAAERTVLSSSWMGGNKLEGLRIDGVGRVRAIGNNFSVNGGNGTSPNVLVKTGSNRTILLGNTFHGGNSTQKGLVLESGTARTKVLGNDFNMDHVAAEAENLGTGTNVFHGNNGFVTENHGLGTIATSTTSIDVEHGLDITPQARDIAVTPTNDMGNATKFWISNVGATTFRINVDADPATKNAIFTWQVRIAIR